ncbi:MAG: M23 family metallopeptidase [Gammaproteobacteria bacterium]|nr:M23 family metallopeptidase [Gammaproteobacteria bacterium]
MPGTDRRWYLAGLLILLLPACASLWPAPYGQAVPDADPVRADGGPNVMPPNAPSILNGHWADYDGHPGIDVIGDVGLPVLAPADGVVTASFLEPMYGHNIVIRHGHDADGAEIQTRLVHLDSRLVEEGERVRRGQQVATLGRTGVLAGGIPHLHFEVQRRLPQSHRLFETVNPHRYWVNGPGHVTCYEEGADYPAEPFLATYPALCR